MNGAPISVRRTLTPLPKTMYTGADHQICVSVHRPCVDASSAVILVEPFGIEALAAESIYRRLTELLVGTGAVVLRFSPPGSGDSGEAVDAAFVTSWIESVADVVRFARELTDTHRVDVVALRLGATIAGYATLRTPVDRIVLWAPVAGKAFVREFKLLGASGAHGADDSDGLDGSAALPIDKSAGGPVLGLFASSEGDLQAGGFALSGQSAELLAPLDLRSIEALGAGKVLLVDRDDLRSVDRVRSHFDALRIPTEVIQPNGYRDMRLDDPEEGLVPEGALRSIVEWLADPDPGPPQTVATDRPASSSGAVDELRLTVGGHVLVEQPTVVNSNGVALAAITTRPASGPTCSPGRIHPTIVMLTTGSNPRCGAGRLQTLLARDLASRGHTVIRYDRRGIGLSIDQPSDEKVGSDTSTENPGMDRDGSVDAYDLRHCKDLEKVVEHVGHVNPAPVILLGMCSGAYTAFHYARALNTRGRVHPVAAVVSINQIIFLDRSWTTKAESPAMAVKAGYELRTSWRNPVRWKSLLSGGIPVRTTAARLGRLVGMRLAEIRSRALVAVHLRRPHALVQALDHIRQAGVRQIYIFDDAETGLGQLRLDGRSACTSLEKSGWMEIRSISGAGHTFGPSESKCWLAKQLSELASPSGDRSPGRFQPSER